MQIKYFVATIIFIVLTGSAIMILDKDSGINKGDYRKLMGPWGSREKNIENPVFSTFFKTIDSADRLEFGGSWSIPSNSKDKQSFRVRITDKKRISQFNDSIIFSDVQFPGRCACLGGPTMIWYKAEKPIVMTALHHRHYILCKGFKGDWTLSSDSSRAICKFLVEQGFTDI